MTKPTLSSRAYLVIDRENQILLRSHPDHLIIQPSNQPTISIDQVRDLIHWVYLKPFSKSPKIAFITQAQKMTPEAQNALLKILEEPPEQTVIVLTVDDEKNLLPTVVSRCLKTDVRSLTSEVGIPEVRSQRSEVESTFSIRHLTSDINYPTSDFRPLTSVREMFDLAESLAKKDREEILEILNAWTLNLRGSLLQNPNPATLDQLKKIKYTREALQANVNKRLALENLFLSLK